MGPRSGVLGIVVLAACTPRAAAPATRVSAAAPAPALLSQGQPGAAAETYADLVRQVAAREAQSVAVESPCLLERVDDRLRFTGFAAFAIRPLPMPAADLEPQLARTVSVNVLTAYGRYGDAAGALTLASFTYAQPTREAVGLIVTDEGVYLRGSDARVPVHNRLARDAAVEAVAQLQPATVFVAAEAQLPTPRLTELLTALDSRGIPVALAVDLPRDATLPHTSEALSPLCPEGLPESAEAEGELTPAQLAAPIAELRARGANCLTASDARGAAGGHLRLLLRVARTGLVEQACARSDETGDARLRACIVSEAKRLRFPEPTPPGVVDLELPLALQPTFPATPALLCDAQLDASAGDARAY